MWGLFYYFLVFRGVTAGVIGRNFSEFQKTEEKIENPQSLGITGFTGFSWWR